jgi:hypothetical protein
VYVFVFCAQIFVRESDKNANKNILFISWSPKISFGKDMNFKWKMYAFFDDMIVFVVVKFEYLHSKTILFQYFPILNLLQYIHLLNSDGIEF